MTLQIRLLLLSAMLTTIALVLPVVALVVFLLRNYIRSHGRNNLPEMRKQRDGEKKPVVVGFFHPYCNAGGGGERVLWVAIRALQKRYKNCRCVIYTGDTDAKGDEILQRAQQRFNIVLPRTSSSDLQFVFLYRRNLVEAKCYPVLTLLGQSVGSVLLGLEALFKFIPDVYIDSMGYAFTLPLFKYLGGCSVGCYVHYPTISTDMLQKVSDRSDTYNNASVISRSPVLSRLKIFYYKLFAFVYGIAGKRNDFIMVNSTWTFGHIASLWKSPDKTNIVYPPCDVEEFLQLPLDNKKKFIVSLGQFRPEKDHALQIKSFSAFLQTMNKEARSEYKLLLVGGCRNKEDESRVQSLQKLTRDLDIEQNVEFRLNVSFKELKNSLAESTIGLHTMWNEHFGIGVVECMAGGVVMLAHDSGGPKLDIVKDFNDHRTGILASDVDSYAQAMRDIFKLNEKDSVSLRKNARESVERFSESEFEIGFLSTIENEMSQYLN